MTWDNKKLSVKQICSIIEACSKYGITKLTYGELSLELNPQSQIPNEYSYQSSIEEEPKSTIEKLNTRESPDEDPGLSDDELAILDLEDPLAFETHVISGDVSAGRDED